jgi:hypothetical protein
MKLKSSIERVEQRMLKSLLSAVLLSLAMLAVISPAAGSEPDQAAPSGPAATGPAPAEGAAPADFIDLPAGDLTRLKKDFNDSIGKIRMLLILSPT